MNIAIVTPEFVSEKVFDGGLANYSYKLAKWLISQGHGVTVYLPVKSDEPVSEFMFEDIPVTRLGGKDYAWLLKYQLQRLKLGFLVSEKTKYRLEFRQHARMLNKRIRADHASKKIDIIHYPHLGGYAFYRPSQIACVARLSSSTELCQKMGGYGSSDLQIDIQVEFEKAAMRKADAVFGPSKMIAALTEPSIGKKISIIETPYVRPAGELDPGVYNTYLKGKRYILFFGSIGLIKGVGTIAEMIGPLLEQHPDLHYVFVGKQLHNTVNNMDVWDYLLQRAGPHKSRVIHIPSQKHQTLFPIIQHAELVTLPSRTDNFPNTCIESMANSKIVIGTKGNGFDQLISDGENGFVIDVDDSQALLAKINFVLGLEPAKKQAIESLSFKRSETLHPDLVLNQLMQLYRNTIKNFK